MMKRFLACLVAVACLLTAFATVALADIMKVVNCNQWVWLRKGPNTNSEGLAHVPLGTELPNCAADEGSEWIAVTFEGQEGYIRGDKLEYVGPDVVPEEEPGVFVPTWPAPVESIDEATDYVNDFIILDTAAGGVNIKARQIFTDEFEYLMIVGLDAGGNELWKQETSTGDVSEMTQTDAFIGGTAAAPLVLMYNDWIGLSALDPATGEVVWEVLKDQVFLGGSISRAVDDNGVAYIGGYYEPEPVAIDAAGNVLWQASSADISPTWMYSLELGANGVEASYAMMLGGESGIVTYDFATGEMRNVLYD